MEIILNKVLFEKINFTKRYEELSKKYSTAPSDDLLEILDIDLTKDIIESFGYKARYYRGERFFRISDKKEGYDFYFNIALDYGMAELIWAVYHNKELVRDVSVPWGVIYQYLLHIKEYSGTPDYSRFRDYDELEDILRDVFDIWEDFKREFLKEVHHKN